MKLNEFYDTHNNFDNDEEMLEDAFWFLLDDTNLHKKYVIRNLSKNMKPATWLPMVKEGIIKYYSEAKIQKPFKELFDKDAIISLCNKLNEHYRTEYLDKE